MTHEATATAHHGTNPGQPENSIALNERGQESAKQADVLASTPPTLNGTDSRDGKTKAKLSNCQGVPETVKSRYLNIDNKYYLPDHALAFEDQGNKLKLDTENREVIKDALSIAEGRGWESISVSGSQNFRRQVWREATIRGLEVSGYLPTKLEIAELAHAQALREARKSIVANNHPQAEKPGQQDDMLRGILIAHGSDHYRHDPKQGQSYYVTLDVGDGKEVTRWGSDFKRALEKAHSLPQVGDAVVIRNIGKQPVDIGQTVVDSNGHVAQEKKTVHKTIWQVEKAGYVDTIREQAEALRIGKEIERRVIVDNPQLANALAVSKLGEKIAAQAKETGALRSQDEVDTMVSHINAGLADALIKGKTIKTPEIQELGKHAAITANNVTNDHQPPKLAKEPQAQQLGLSR